MKFTVLNFNPSNKTSTKTFYFQPHSRLLYRWANCFVTLQSSLATSLASGKREMTSKLPPVLQAYILSRQKPTSYHHDNTSSSSTATASAIAIVMLRSSEKVESTNVVCGSLKFHRLRLLHRTSSSLLWRNRRTLGRTFFYSNKIVSPSVLFFFIFHPKLVTLNSKQFSSSFKL